MVRMPIGETLFTLAYGHKAMPPVEVELPTYKVEHFKQCSNDRQFEEQLDLLEGIREKQKSQ